MGSSCLVDSVEEVIPLVVNPGEGYYGQHDQMSFLFPVPQFQDVTLPGVA